MRLISKNIKSYSIKRLILLGLFLGIMAALFPGTFAVILASAVLLAAIYRASLRHNDRRLFVLFAAGFSLRLILIGLLSVISLLKHDIITLFGDSKLYFGASREIYLILAGIQDMNSIKYFAPGMYGYNFFTLIYGGLYYLFGHSPFLIRFVNTLAGSLLCWMIYLITFRIYQNRTIAAVSMGLCLFWPSQILWSI